MSIIELSQSSFDEVLHKHSLVVLDFWAQWCGPCKSLKKVIEGVAQAYPDVVFAGVDIDAEKALAEEFGIRSVPSVMILRERVVVFAESGALSVSVLTELIEQAKALDPEKLKEAAKESGDS